MRSLLIVALVLVVAACGTSSNDPDSNSEPVVVEGELVYAERLEGANTYTCSTCHALTEPAPDGITRPGHAIGGAPDRPSFKNGRVDSFLAAVNSCVTEWMVGEPWAEDDAEFVALRDYLRDGGDATEALTFEIVDPPADLTGGDAEAGQARFDTSCSVCHGEGGGGTNKAPPIAGRELDRQYVADRIRLSGETTSEVYDDLIGGRMPFFAASRLDDQEVLDIVAYVATSEMVAPGNNINAAPNNVNNVNNGELRECGATHAKIGQSLQFSNLFHDVSGTATIVDDCTIEITDFTYDGTGIDVRIYAGVGGNYHNGFAISPDLLAPQPYDGATLTVQLPVDRTLDEVDGLSVWCVAVGSSFGDGLFQ